MKLAIKLAYRNLIGAGLRTWLNVIVLSFAFVVILWLRGMMTGWDLQAKRDMTDYEIGGGQYWYELYDPYDPFTLHDSHAPVPEKFSDEIEQGDMEPVLIVQGTIFPQGRMQSVSIRGINPRQTIFRLPAHKLDTVADAIPAFIGAMTAESARLKVGDFVTMRWRDAGGTFDAAEIVITGIFYSNVPAVEASQVYIALDRLQEMMGLPGHATILTFRESNKERPEIAGWVHKPREELTEQVDASEFGMAMAQTLYPVFSVGLVISTVLLLTVTTAIVSWLPSRKIARMNPTEALRGKLQ